MDIGKLGVWTFQLGASEDAPLRDAVAELESLGYGTIWFPGGGRAFETARRLLAASSTITVATGIVSIYGYEAADVVAQTASLAADYPGRFLLGLGVSHPEAVNREGPPRYSRPLRAMGGFLDALDASASAGASSSSSEVVLAALRTGMLELAKARTRGAHPYFVPVEHTARAREVLGPDKLLAPEQAIVLDEDPESARRIARTHMALYLRLQNYTNNLRGLGYGDADLSDGGSDRLVDAIVAWGDPETVASRVRAHYDAGADHVCVQALDADFRAVPTRQWIQLAEALR